MALNSGHKTQKLATSIGVLVNILSGKDLEAGEFEEVGQMVNEFTHPDTTVIVDAVLS